MSEVFAAAGTDRLPWLQDEPKAPRRKAAAYRELAGWAVAGVLAVASGAYWLGAHSEPATGDRQPGGRMTVALPRPDDTAALQPDIAIERQPQVAAERQPQVAPPVRRDVPISRPPQLRAKRLAVPDPSLSAPQAVATAEPAVQQRHSTTVSAPLTLWPAWQSQGAAGRVVRVGAFGSRRQAKIGWRTMVRAYPAVAHLQATVVGTRNSRGRGFYRFQIGTTSQAHSEVLCQRMEQIRLSCAVVGLPWKPGGVER